MKRRSLARAVLLAGVVSATLGCRGPRVVRMYTGPKRDPAQVARLYQTPVARITRIDSTKAAGPDAFGRATVYELLPGRHSVTIAQPRDPSHWNAIFDYDFAAGQSYGFRVTQVLRDDGRIQSWTPRLVDYESSLELAAPR